MTNPHDADKLHAMSLQLDALMRRVEERDDSLRELHSRVSELEADLRHADRELGLEYISGPNGGLVLEAPPSVSGRVLWWEAVNAAALEWLRDVAEPPGPNWERIDAYIRGSQGLGWSLAAVKPGHTKEYTQNGQFAWCGAFAAHCLGAAGLKASIRKSVMPSCYRLWEFVRRGKDSRCVPLEEVQPGDVLVVGRANGTGKTWGDHITLIRERYEAGSGEIQTYEGNSVGPGPHGGTREGVIKRSRPLVGKGRTYVAKYAVRFAVEDRG